MMLRHPTRQVTGMIGCDSVKCQRQAQAECILCPIGLFHLRSRAGEGEHVLDVDSPALA
jgi:hypothetical protein